MFKLFYLNNISNKGTATQKIRPTNDRRKTAKGDSTTAAVIGRVYDKLIPEKCVHQLPINQYSVNQQSVNHQIGSYQNDSV